MTIRGAMTYNRYRVRRRETEPGFVFEARNDQVSQTLLIPGLDRLDPNKLFAQGQPGGWPDPYDLTRMWIDDAGTTPATIASLGTGIGRVITKGNAITLVQANAADRPVWGRHPVSGIRNVLERTEELNNAYYDGLNATIGAADSDGFFPITETSDNSVHSFRTSSDVLDGTLQYGFQALVKPGLRTVLALSRRSDTGTTLAVRNFEAVFNFVTKTVTVGATSGPASIVEVSPGVFLIKANPNVGGTASEYRRFVVRLLTGTSGAADYTYAGDNTQPAIWLKSLGAELGSTATPYQSVTNRFDVTETGVPSLYYFSCNGVNQSWSSNATVDFSGTDKVTVWAGLRSLTDSVRGMVCELTSLTITNSGGFGLNAPSGTAGTAAFITAPTSGDLTLVTSAYASPATLALVGESSISGDFIRLTLNGVALENTSDKGSGNHVNATLHVGRRAGSSLPLNGIIYNLIVAGDNYDTRTIQRFSDWLLKPRRLITA